MQKTEPKEKKKFVKVTMMGKYNLLKMEMLKLFFSVTIFIFLV